METQTGCTLFTKFTDGNYRGVVTSVNKKNETGTGGEELFHVQYDDGDEDDMTWKEIQEHVVVVVGSDVEEEEDSSDDEDSSEEMEEDSSDDDEEEEDSSDDEEEGGVGGELVEDSSEEEEEMGKKSVLRRIHVAGMGHGQRSRKKRETGKMMIFEKYI